MKKILIIFILLALLSVGSCKKKPTAEDLDFETSSDERITIPERSKDDNIRLVINTFFETSSKEDTSSVDYFGNHQIEYMEANNAVYLRNDETCVLYEKEPINKTYELDKEANIRYELEANSDLDIVLDFLIYHHNIDQSKFILKKELVDYNGFETYVYYHEYRRTFNDHLVYGKETYYLSKDYSTVYGYEYLSQVGDIEIQQGFKVDVLNNDGNYIIGEITKYLNYPVEYKTKFYDNWPDTNLSRKLPEFKAGEYATIWDKVKEFYVYKNLVTKMDVDAYVGSLVSYGFVPYKVRSEDSLSYEYITYDADCNLVLIKFVGSERSVSIDVKMSNQEDIEIELKRFK